MKLHRFIKGFKEKSIDFIQNIQQEGGETKEAFLLLKNSIETGVELTPEEKKIIGEQLRDVLKTIGVVGIALVPGGSVFFILSTYFKVNKYILPSSFDNNKTSDVKIKGSNKIN